MRILTTFWVVLGLCAQIWANEPRITRIEIKKEAPKQSKARPRGLNQDKAMARYLEQREEQNKLLFARTMTPHIWEGNRQVLTGKTYRAILDFGILDVDVNDITPVDKSISFAGTTSDMTVYDVGDNLDKKGKKKYKVGSQIVFKPNYMAVARLMNTVFIEKKIV